MSENAEGPPTPAKRRGWFRRENIEARAEATRDEILAQVNATGTELRAQMKATRAQLDHANEVIEKRTGRNLPLAIIIGLLKRGQAVAAVVRHRRTLLTLLVSTALIAANWYTYIYAVESGQVLQASLGYFITPLANMVML